MLIEKSTNHKSFYVKNKIVYEKRNNAPTRKVRELNFSYPDNDFLTEQHITYLNKHFEFHNKTKETPGAQIDLFS